MSHVFLSFTDNQQKLKEKTLAVTKARSIKNNILEIDEEELDLIPDVIAEVIIFGQNAGVEVGIKNTKDLIDSYTNRIYLKYEPYQQQVREQIKNHNKFHFDFIEKKYYVLKNDLSDYEVRSLLRYCYNNRAILASDFNSGPITKGKIELAQALNCSFDYEKPSMLANALISCLEENLHQVKGAIRDFHDLDRNVYLIKEFIPYVKEWNLAHDEKSANRRASIFLSKLGKTQQKLALKELKNAFADPTFCNQLMINLALRNYLYGTRLYLYGQTLISEFKPNESFKEFKYSLEEILSNHSLSKNEQFFLDKSIRALEHSLNNIEKNYISELSADAFNHSLDDIKIFLGYLQNEGYLFMEKKPENLLKEHCDTSKLYPLYLVLSTKKYNELNDPSIYFDSLNHAYFVENTEENRKLFAQFLPENNLRKTNEISEDKDLLGKIRSLLKENGYSDKVISSFTLSDKWFYDKEKGKNSRSFRVINPFSKSPLLVLHSFKDESLSKNIPLGEFDRRQTFDAVYEQKKQIKCEEIAELQKRIDKGRSITADLNLLKPFTELKGYVAKKGFDPNGIGLLSDPDGTFTARFNPRLSKEDPELYKKVVYAPLYNANGLILNVQQISESGEKKFLNGVITKGLFAVCGDFNKLENSDKIYVAEGIATAASIANHADDNSCVVAALTCGNIQNTVKSLAEKFPEKSFAIMADLDVMTAAKPMIINGEDKGQFFKNPGILAALETKKLLEYDVPQIQICLPPLRKKDLAEKKSDFNDCFTTNPDLCLSRFKEFNDSFEYQSINKKKALDIYLKAYAVEESFYKNRVDQQTAYQESYLDRVKKEMDEDLKEKTSPLGKNL